MSKRFKQKELTGENIDETLAENITDLFRNGMDESQYNEMIKDELNTRPGNCDGLTCDKKMQNIERSVVKAAVLLSKTVNKVAKTDNETNEFSEVIDECNDVLALLGHTNRQINLARRDFIKYELNNEYTNLCAQSQPYTTFLFGDDVSKVAKDIEDCSKIAHRIHFGRGSSRSRGRFGRGGRGIFGRGRGRGRGIGRGSYESHSRQDFSSTSNDSRAKNYPRRGGSRGFRKMYYIIETEFPRPRTRLQRTIAEHRTTSSESSNELSDDSVDYFDVDYVLERTVDSEPTFTDEPAIDVTEPAQDAFIPLGDAQPEGTKGQKWKQLQEALPTLMRMLIHRKIHL
ncbi:unnamed protein product [Mytilus coruscus]|uniref:Uncharacterized protein n=1 Tax=Mytilus coruscus TaxID=42192 RepID=A0A6J8BWF9_MYTCO|nr:unnamed protein product [Mytilus coruscus]